MLQSDYGNISRKDSWIHSRIEPSKIAYKLSISKVYMRDILSQESIRDQLGSIKQVQTLIFLKCYRVNSSCQSAIMIIASNQLILALIFYPIPIIRQKYARYAYTRLGQVFS
ncbi:Hypothetical_protein [Hexamita inflata]|uniref:Hypothetical_protein n=1 Tax=Hexamita inflata TaxID=28002 RepID=A0AA86P5F3_9EUKA|nr:Hypothetical protein HINF_LOCUS19603 [Hexamita inflata]